MDMDVKKVLDYIDAHQEEYVTFFQDLLRQPSYAQDKEDIAKMKEKAKAALSKIGITAQEIPTSGNPVIYGELKGEVDRTLAFYDHYDVQPVDPIELWNSDPYAAEIRDGRIFARGVADNKDGIASRICAADAYLKVYGKLPLNLKYIFEGEEEIGSPHLREFAKAHPDKIAADGYAWEGGFKEEDGPAEVTLGVKGLTYVELHCKGAAIDSHSKDAAIVVNPAWRLVWALATMKDANENVLIEGFYDKVKPLTQFDWDAMESVKFDEEGLKKTLGIQHYLQDVTGTALLERLLYKPTCNICGIKSGYIGPGSKTVLPCEASVKIDFRLVPDQDPDEIVQLLRAHLDRHGFDDIEIEYHSGQPAFRTDPETLYAKTVIRSMETLMGEPPMVYYSCGGTSPMHEFCLEAGIPGAMFGCCNSRSQIHSPNENMRVSDFMLEIKMVAQVMHDFAAAE